MLWEEMDVLFIKAEERGFHLSHLERKKKKGNAEGRTNRAESKHISGGDKHLDGPAFIFSFPITLWSLLHNDSSLF